MRQRLFPLCSAVLIVLCAVTLALWVRSYHRGDQIGWYINRWNAGDGRFGAIGFDSDSGGIVFFLQRRESHLDLLDPADAVFRSDNPPLCEPSWITHDPYGYPYMTDYAGMSGFGFGYFGGPSDRTELPMVYRDHFIVMPGWSPSILAAVLPALWFIRWRRHRSTHEPDGGGLVASSSGESV